MGMAEFMLAQMTALEAEFSPRLANTLEQGMVEMAAHLRQTHFASEPSPQFVQAVRQELAALWSTAAAVGMAAFEAEELKSSELLAAIVSDFALAFGNANARQITETTQRQVQDLISGGLAAGEAVDAVYGELFEKIPQMASIRGLMISRTEVHSAMQFAAWRMALRSSIPLVKVWNSIADEATRDFGELGKISAFNHRVMDGQKIPLVNPFMVPKLGGGHEPLLFPGDPTGSAGNIINCRCVQTYERAK